MSKLLVLTMLACLWAACWTYPTGAPSTACSSMTPMHGTTDTASLAKSYSITTSKSQYSPGDKITVTISGNNGAKFRGFLVQGRQEPSGSSAVGTMTIATGGKSTCNQAAVTHAAENDKPSVSFEWTAPSSSVGDVRIWATIVQTMPNWTNIKGPVIKAAGASGGSTVSVGSTVTKTTTPTGTFPSSVGLPACGKTKSCFKSSIECITNCEFLLMWETAGSDIKFEMSGITDGYVAVGFSKDQKMGDDNVIMCTNRGEVTNRYQPDKVEPEPIDERNPRFGLTSSSVISSAPGRVNCTFSRKRTFEPTLQNPVGSGVNVTQVFDLKNSYYLLLARGDLDASGEPEMHDRRPSISVKKIDLTQSLLVVDEYPPIFIGAAGLTVDTAFIIRNSIFGFRSQITIFSLLIMKIVL